MRIIYDDIVEAAEVVIRCNATENKGKCMWCPFYDRCAMYSLETRSVTCGDIELPKEVE